MNRSRGPYVAARKGAMALLIRSVGTDTDRLPHTGMISGSQPGAPVPSAALSNPDADNLMILLSQQAPVRVRLDLDVGFEGSATSYNVVGSSMAVQTLNSVCCWARTLIHGTSAPVRLMTGQVLRSCWRQPGWPQICRCVRGTEHVSCYTPMKNRVCTAASPMQNCMKRICMNTSSGPNQILVPIAFIVSKRLSCRRPNPSSICWRRIEKPGYRT